MSPKMSVKGIVLLVVILLLAVSSSYAQLSSPVKLYLGGGPGIQHKPPVFSDWYKSGRHVTGGIGYSLMPMVELVGTAEHHGFSNKIDDAIGGTLEGAKINTTLFGLQARFVPSLPMVPIKPYGLAGVGMAMVKQSDFVWKGEVKIGTAAYWEDKLSLEDQTKLYYSIGAGVNYSLIPKIGLFFEARYINIKIDGANTVFETPLRFWAVTGGIRVL